MAINLWTTALMPISQLVSWYLVATSTTGSSTSSSMTQFYNRLGAIAGFYCAWALYNRYLGGNVRELGQYSMGVLTICSYYHKYAPTVLATCLVLFNFLAPSYFILIKWNSTELARNVKNDTSSLAITWANIFKAYFVSNIALWSYVLYKFYKYRVELDRTYSELPNSISTEWLPMSRFESGVRRCPLFGTRSQYSCRRNTNI